jgi:hypothetical protein
MRAGRACIQRDSKKLRFLSGGYSSCEALRDRSLRQVSTTRVCRRVSKNSHQALSGSEVLLWISPGRHLAGLGYQNHTMLLCGSANVKSRCLCTGLVAVVRNYHGSHCLPRVRIAKGLPLVCLVAVTVHTQHINEIVGSKISMEFSSLRTDTQCFSGNTETSWIS